MGIDTTYFYYLVLLSSISFGGHFSRSTFSMFGLYMINDNVISPAGLGMLLGTASLPSMIIPLLVGHSVDKTRKEFFITLMLFFFEFTGLTMFCVSVYIASFPLAMVGMFVYGVGSSSITTMQRILVTLFLKVTLVCCTVYYHHDISMHFSFGSFRFIFRTTYRLQLDSTLLLLTLRSY